MVNNNKKKKAKKGKKAFIIDFYGEEKVEDKIVF